MVEVTGANRENNLVDLLSKDCKASLKYFSSLFKLRKKISSNKKFLSSNCWLMQIAKQVRTKTGKSCFFTVKNKRI